MATCDTLPVQVQMQYMRPSQLEAALRAFPAVYVPFGLIEWHGRHLPLGNDALKAHAVLVKTAEQFGGLDPRKHASPEIGRRNIELAAAAIGRKARELLESLPEEYRGFGLPCIAPGNWWLI